MGQCLSIALQVLDTHQQQQQEEENQQQQQTNESPSSPAVPDDLSPVYSSLPSDAEQYKVRNVYDGDTLTLVDERRVRFLGVDTPELKEKQPFAQEAKQYTKSRCSNEVWISFEPGKDRQDHYGRLLCFVWTSTDDGNYLCVNEGLIQEGLAGAYVPNKNQKLHNWDKLVQLQKEARTARRGMWQNFQDDEVYKTQNGSAFHKKDCQHLAKVKHLTSFKKSHAMDLGLHACRTCMG